MLADSDHVGQVVCAILHDPTNSAGGAIALAAIERRLSHWPVTILIASAVLATGCRVHKVFQVERRLGMSRQLMGEMLAVEGGCGPKDVVRLARSLYAVAVLRLTSLTVGKVAQHTYFSASRWLRVMLRSELEVTVEQIRAVSSTVPIATQLDRLVGDWARRRGRLP